MKNIDRKARVLYVIMKKGTEAMNRSNLLLTDELISLALGVNSCRGLSS